MTIEETKNPPAGWVELEHAPRDGSVFFVWHKTSKSDGWRINPYFAWPRVAVFNYGCEGRLYLLGLEGEEGGSTLPEEEWGEWLCLIPPPLPGEVTRA